MYIFSIPLDKHRNRQLKRFETIVVCNYSSIRLALTENKFKLDYVIASPSTERSILLVYIICVILGPMLVFTETFMGQCPNLEFY